MDFFTSYIATNAHQLVGDVLSSGHLSEGDVVRKFEADLCRKLGLTNIVSLNSGTSALHLSLILAGVRKGDEVIVPAQTFIATALAVLMVDATPVFADINPSTGNICPNSISSLISAKTKAIIPVHWAGYPCDLERICEIASSAQIKVIEDAAHAIGATYKGQAIGTISDFTAFSFQAIKHLTTGDGGAISCRCSDDYQNATIRRWFGIDRKSSETDILGERIYDLRVLGFKYHLNNYAAALGLANLAGLAERLERHRAIAQFYKTQLTDIPGIDLLQYDTENESAFWFFPLKVERRTQFAKSLRSRGVPCSVVHRRIDRHEIFEAYRRDLPGQTHFDEVQINLPIHVGLTDNDINRVVEAVKQGW